MEVDPGAQCVCIRGYICRSPPPACQYTEGVPPPPARSGGEDRPPETAAGPVLTMEAHPRVVGTHPVAKEALPGVFEVYLRSIEVQKLKQLMFYLGPRRLILEQCRLSLE
jgi:hypothetical protein